MLVCAFVSLALAGTQIPATETWPQWRGPSGDSVATTTAVNPGVLRRVRKL